MSCPIRFAINVTAVLSISGGLFAQTAFQITFPTDGTVLNPGETIQVNVSVSGPAPAAMVIIGTGPLDFTQTLTAPPFQFAVTVPTTTAPGLYNLRAHGVVKGAEVSSVPVSIDVERPDSPLNISINHLQLNVSIGHQSSIQVDGSFADGSVVDLTKSTRTKYEVTPAGIASVSRDGFLTALAAGAGTVIVSYEDKRSILRVIVTPGQK
jgi:hypothetical protein